MIRFYFIPSAYFLNRILASAVLAMMVTCSCIAQSIEPLPDSVKEFGDTMVLKDIAAGDSQKVTVVAPDSAVLRSVPDSVVGRYKQDKDFAYANDAAYWKKEPVQNNRNFFDYFWTFLTSKGMAVLGYLLIAAVLLFAFYRIVIDNKLYLFYSTPKKQISDKGHETGQEREDIDEKINLAMHEMDYRIAIRWMHLKALLLLSDRGFIRFHADGTNQEYLAEFSNHAQSKSFQQLTHVYEYAWYGGFALTRQQAENLQHRFNQFYNTIEN